MMSAAQKLMFAEMQDKTIFTQALEYGYQYIDGIGERNVYPTEEALRSLKIFEEVFPEHLSTTPEILELLDHYGSPATVAQTGRRYFGFVCGSVLPAGIAAKTLGTFWDQNTAMYVLSPLASKLEAVVENWLRSIFYLPDKVVAGFVSGTSTANLCGLAAARYRLLQNQNWDVNRKGLLNAPKLRVIAGAEAHSTVIKAVNILGFGIDAIEFIETDKEGRIMTELIPEPDNKTLIVLQAGNVNSGSFDDFSNICEKAAKANAWVHIDGAFGLWAAACSNLRHLTHGIQYANSWSVDGHKTLNTPYDCGIVMCNDREALAGALHMSAGYIVVSEDRDGMYYTPEMSRRARIIELWATLKYLGKMGMEQMIWQMHQRAKQFASALNETEGFTVLNDVVFNQVLVCCASDQLTNKVIENIQQERVCWVGGSTWKGKKVIRISVCSWATTEQDVDLSVASFKSSLRNAIIELKTVQEKI